MQQGILKSKKRKAFPSSGILD